MTGRSEGKPRRGPRIAAAAVWLTAMATLIAWAAGTGRGPASAVAALVDALQGSVWGPAAFVGVFLVRPLVLFPATLLSIAAGVLFGPVLGIALVIVAANASAMVAYGTARWLGAARPDAGGRLGAPGGWAARVRERGFATILLMRLLYLPFDLVSYLAGALRVPPAAFLAGTAVGGAPASVAIVLFGASLERFEGGVPRPDLPVLVASLVTLVAGLAVAGFLRRREGGPPQGEGRPA